MGLLLWFAVNLPFICTLHFLLTSMNISKFTLKLTYKKYFSIFFSAVKKKKLLKSVKKGNEDISYFNRKLLSYISIILFSTDITLWKWSVVFHISLMDLSTAPYNRMDTYLITYDFRTLGHCTCGTDGIC